MKEPLSAMDANVSDNTRDQIRSSDSSVPKPILSQYKASNIMPPGDIKRCQNKINRDNSLNTKGETAQNIEYPSNQQTTTFKNPNIQNGSNVDSGTQVENAYDATKPISNNKINHYHKIHKNVRNRARKFDNSRPSKSAFLGGLFTDLTASEDTLLLENGEVHQMCERSKLSSNDPMIKMPSIFGSSTNINNNSALISESPVTSGAISKHNRPPRKSVNIQSPTKEIDGRSNNPVTMSSIVDAKKSPKDGKNRRNPEVPPNRAVGDQITTLSDKTLEATTKGKKGPQVRSIVLKLSKSDYIYILRVKILRNILFVH